MLYIWTFLLFFLEQDECSYDPESCLDYPRFLDLDLDRDLGDDETFDVETCTFASLSFLSFSAQLLLGTT